MLVAVTDPSGIEPGEAFGMLGLMRWAVVGAPAVGSSTQITVTGVSTKLDDE